MKLAPPPLPFLLPAAAALVLGLQAAVGGEPWAWGLAGYREASFPVALAAAALLLVGSFFPPPQGLLRAAGRLGAGPRPWLAGALAALLFSLGRSHHLVGDWSLVLARLQQGHYYPSNLGANLAFRLVRAAAAPFGADADDAVALTSALAGGVWVAALLRLAAAAFPRDATGAGGFTLFVLLTGLLQVFQGHLEVYAPLLATTGLFLCLWLRLLRQGSPPAPAGYLLGLATVMHGSAALLLPPYLWVAARRAERPLRGVLVALSTWAVPVLLAAAVLFLLLWRGRPPLDPALRWGTWLGAAGQGLFVAPQTLADPGHFWDRLNVLLRVAAGPLLCLPWALRARGRGREVTPFLVILLLWVPLHRVAYPLPLDWDLFALPGFLLALWTGLRLASHFRRTAGPLLLGAWTSLPWWGSAAFPPPDREARYHLALAAVYQEYRGPGAEAAYLDHLRRAASLGRPPDRTALEALTVYLAERRRPEAEVWLRRAVAAYPRDPAFHANLGLWYQLKGRYGEALRELETAVRLAPDQAPFHHDLAGLFEQLQRPEEAYAHARRAARLAPGERRYVERAARLALALNRPREALALLEALLARAKPTRALLDALYRAALRAGQLEKARRYQRRLETLPPSR